MIDNNKNLILLGNGGLPAAIERRTQITNQVLGQLSSDQTEAFFRKHPEFFWLVVSRYYPLDEELIEYFGDCLDWKRLSENEALPWSMNLIECFEDRWIWDRLRFNDSLPWSIDLIQRFEDRWDWESLSSNDSLPWSIDLIERYKDQWIWGRDTYFWNVYHRDCGGLSWNEALPWSIDFIERYNDRWDWSGLSQNEALPWSIDFFERFEDRWAWEGLSRNTALPWSIDFIERFEDRCDRWEWEGLSQNTALPWSFELIERYKDRWNWGGDDVNNMGGLSGNEALPWSIGLIERFEDRWNWLYRLSRNNALPWSIDLIQRFEDRWNWHWLSENTALPWSIGLIERFEDRWNWLYRLSRNNALPWSIDLIEHYKDRWDWEGLSRNTALPWSHRFYERFAEKWIIEEVAKIYDGNICNLSREQVTRLLTELTSQDALKALKDIHEEVKQGVQGNATKQVNLAAYKLGNILPDGGIVFHVDASGKHGLAAQPADEAGEADWDQAKLLAEAHGQDWHMPTKDELALLYEQKNVVGGFANNVYWSSTEYGHVLAWDQYFDTGYQYVSGKDIPTRVRAVRAFNVEFDFGQVATEKVNSAAYKLGDVLLDGGIVFHVDSSGRHGLAAQSVDETDETGEIDWDQAKLLAEAHGLGWHMPTKDELALLYEQKNFVGGFANFLYWSSTEANNRDAWYQSFLNGHQVVSFKFNALRVRAVRAF